MAIQKRFQQEVGEKTLAFFRNQSHFLSHLRRHFIKDSEPWDEVLGADGSKFIDEIRLKLGTNEEIVAKAYERFVTSLIVGIEFAVRVPLHITYCGKVIGEHGGVRPIRDGFLFLSADGYVVVAVDQIVRTAYFLGGQRKLSRRDRFEATWWHLRRKYLLTQDNSAETPTRNTYVYEHVRPFDFSTWSALPDATGELRDKPPLPDKISVLLRSQHHE